MLHAKPESAGDGWLKYGEPDDDDDGDENCSGDVIDECCWGCGAATEGAAPPTLPQLLPGVMGLMTPESAGEGVGW